MAMDLSNRTWDGESRGGEEGGVNVSCAKEGKEERRRRRRERRRAAMVRRRRRSAPGNDEHNSRP